VTDLEYRVTPWASGYDLEAFDCGDEEYNEWLSRSAERACKAGTSAVYLLVAVSGEAATVVGYYAICPTMIVKEAMPKALQRGSMSQTPGWLLTKLAVSRDLRGGPLGEQLLREALRTIARSANAGGGRVIAVDAGHPELIDWYQRRGFTPTGIVGSNRLYLKVSTAQRYLLETD
jgi:ribosomal protein S18 acetylase RimI-like enzyme